MMNNQKNKMIIKLTGIGLAKCPTLKANRHVE